MFEVSGTKSLDEGKLSFKDTGINFVGRVNDNNGVKGKIDLQNFPPNEKDTITATVIGQYKYVKFQSEPYYTSQNINKLKPLFKWNKHVIYYIITHIQKFVSQYNGQQGGYKLDALINCKITLPTINNQIAFDFMQDLMTALSKQVVHALNAYTSLKIQTAKEVINK